jgi:tetratricopeptide (TPR) repeat protein
VTQLEKAEQLIQSGAFDEAENILMHLISEDPDDLDAIRDIGIVYSETGKTEQAIKALEYFLRHVSDDAPAWEALGCSLFRQGQYNEALDCFDKALAINGDNPSVLRNKGVLLGVLGRKRVGYELVNRAFYLKPDDFRTLYALSYIHREFGYRDRARQAMERILTLPVPDDIRRDTVVNMIKLDLKWD